MSSTSVAESKIKGLKERLEQRGRVCVQSVDAGWPKLTIDSEASIKIDASSVSTKDIIGNADAPYSAHNASLAVKLDTCSQADVAVIMLELAKIGLKITYKEHATVLATAEAAAGTVLQFDVTWPSAGI